MFEGAFLYMQSIILPLGGWGVFLAMFIAQVIPPINSVAIMMASGLFFLKGEFTLSFLNILIFKIALPASAGLTIGSLLVYYLALIGSEPMIKKWGRFVKVSWEDIERWHKKFESGYLDESAIFVLRSVPFIPTVAVTVLCGVLQIKLRTYIIYTFLGTFVRTLIVALLAWQAGAFYFFIIGSFGLLEKISFALIVLAIGWFLWSRKKRRQREGK